MRSAFAGLADWVMVIALDTCGGDIKPSVVIRDVDEFIAGDIAGIVAGAVSFTKMGA